MRELLRTVDDLLRGNFTSDADLSEGRVGVSSRRLILIGAVLGGVYGICMGLFAVLRGGDGALPQLLATAAKVPLLFLLTLVVTFPSLYVFSALNGSRLRIGDSLRLLLIAIGVDLAVLASLGPVTAFFTFSTDSYPFMVLLNVAFFAIAGFIGLAVLRRLLGKLFERPVTDATKSDQSKRVFSIWVVVYGVVGAQMGWILRPFIGAPGAPFELFRERDSNFFQAVLDAIAMLLGVK